MNDRVAECKGYIEAAYDQLLPRRFASLEASVQLLAICGQEADFQHRRQIGGPARGLLQFEQGGGVRAVLVDPKVRLHTRAVCLLRGIAPTEADVYLALALDDVFAFAIARLYLYTDRQPLPPANVEAVLTAYAAYISPWHPGREHEEDWPRNHQLALEAYGVA